MMLLRCIARSINQSVNRSNNPVSFSSVSVSKDYDLKLSEQRGQGES